MLARVVWVGLVTIGCGDSQTPTSELSARLNATIDEFRIDVSLSLFELLESGPVPYRSDPDEHVLAMFQAQVVELTFSEFQGRNVYVGSIAVDEVAGDEEVTATFDRGSAGTTTITGTVPTPFTVTPPSTQSGSQDVVVTWSPVANDAMRWFGQACGDGFSLEGPIPEDIGMLTFPPGVLTSPSSTFDCNVTLVFVRERLTTLDSEFQSASVTVSQAHTVQFTLTP